MVDPENRNRKSNPLNRDFVYVELATRDRLEEFFSYEFSDLIFYSIQNKRLTMAARDSLATEKPVALRFQSN